VTRKQRAGDFLWQLEAESRTIEVGEKRRQTGLLFGGELSGHLSGFPLNLSDNAKAVIDWTAGWHRHDALSFSAGSGGECDPCRVSRHSIRIWNNDKRN